MAGSHQGRQFQLRHQQALRFIVPQLQATGRPLSQMRALEIGCGEAPKLCALAPLFKDYVGIDLDGPGLRKGRANAAALGIGNADLRLQEAADLPDILAQERFDVVFLYAVLEHLTVEERLTTLMLCWESLPEDGLLYVGEAPSRIAPVDYHSSRLPYFHMMPPELAAEFVDRSAHAHWKTRVRAEKTPDLGLFRNGQHVGSEEFDLAIAPPDRLSAHLLADNWAAPMMNLYPLRWFEPRNLDDFDELARAGLLPRPLPPMFARYWIEGILSRRAVAEPLRPVRFVPLPQAVRDTAAPDRLGVPLLPVAPRQSLRLTLAQDARQLSLGVGMQSTGAFRLYLDDTPVAEYDSGTLRAATAGLWPLQSWTALDLAARAGQDIRIEALPDSALALCPPFTR